MGTGTVLCAQRLHSGLGEGLCELPASFSDSLNIVKQHKWVLQAPFYLEIFSICLSGSSGTAMSAAWRAGGCCKSTSPQEADPHHKPKMRIALGEGNGGGKQGSPPSCIELNFSFASLLARPNPSSPLPNPSGPPHLFSHRCLHAEQRSSKLLLGEKTL